MFQLTANFGSMKIFVA